MCFFSRTMPTIPQAAPAPAPTPQPSLVSPEAASDSTAGLRAANTGKRSLRIDLASGGTGTGVNVPQ